MKLSYFGYHIECKDNSNEEMYQFDIRSFLKGFCNYTNISYKNGFKSATDENLYLFYHGYDVFLYVMTKNHEIIKTINTSSLGVEEIYDKLNQNEQLGFASYVYVQDCYYGIASTMLGPKNRSFVDFINDIITSVKLQKYKLSSTAFMHQSTKADVLKMPIIGRTTIEVGHENSFFKHIAEFAAMDSNEISSFEITIKPCKNTSITKSFAKLSSAINNEGLIKYIARAKEQEKEALEDFYIASMGGLADSITSRDEKKIYEEISRKSQANATLTAKVAELRHDKSYCKDPIQDLTGFDKPDSWASRLSGV